MKKIIFALTLLSALPASAKSINVQTYRAPVNLNYGQIESAVSDSLPWDESSQPKYYFGANYHYAQDPLVQIDAATNKRVRTLVDSIHTADFAAGYFWQPNFSLYLQAPMHLVQLPNQPHFFEVGDMRLSSKWQLSDLKSPVAFSVMPELVTPSGNNKRFLSDDSLGMGVLLLAEKDFGGFRIAANLGYRYSKSAIISGIDFRHRMPVGLGSAIKLSKRLLLNAEIRGFMTLPVSQQQNPGEFYLGLNYHTRKDFALIAGGSVGTLEEQGSLNYRFQGALRMYLSPAPEAAKPVYANTSVKKAKLQGDTIAIADEINFEHNSDRLLASAAAVLDDVGELILKAADRIKSVQIEGHTSLVGSAAQNQDLSQRRAKAVEQYLVNVSGVPANLLTAKGYGASRPRFLPGKASRADLERNRRVEFNIIPKQ